MDYYKEFVEVFEKHADELVEEVVAELQSRGYLQNDEAVLLQYTQEARNLVKVIIEIVRTGDPKPWRDLAARLTGRNIGQNGEIVGFEHHSKIYNQKMKDLVEREFADQPKLKASYLRRIDSISMVGNVSAISSTISTKKPPQ